MITLAQGAGSPRSEAESVERFVEMLPQIERQLGHAFRNLDPEGKQEAVRDGIVHCWLAYRRLVQQGRADKAFASVLAGYTARQIREGRSCGARSSFREPLSGYAQRKRGIRVERLDRHCRRAAEWLGTLSRRLRGIAEDPAVGHSTSEVARRHGLSAGRISQVRRGLVESWHRFLGGISELPAAG